jgi:hypothetical protein
MLEGDSGTGLSFVGCAKVEWLHRSRKAVHSRSRTPIVGIAWVHSLNKLHWLGETLAGVTETHHERLQ